MFHLNYFLKEYCESDKKKEKLSLNKEAGEIEINPLIEVGDKLETQNKFHGQIDRGRQCKRNSLDEECILLEKINVQINSDAIGETVEKLQLDPQSTNPNACQADSQVREKAYVEFRGKNVTYSQSYTDFQSSESSPETMETLTKPTSQEQDYTVSSSTPIVKSEIQPTSSNHQLRFRRSSSLG